MYNLKTKYKKMLADTITPVGIYLKLRDKFVNTFLLESSDYHGTENSYSYICCDPIASFKLLDDEIFITYPDKKKEQFKITDKKEALNHLQNFTSSFNSDHTTQGFVNNGIFGYMSFDSVEYFEDIKLHSASDPDTKIPQMFYQVFRYIIVINHFKDELFIFKHYLNDSDAANGIELIESLIENKNYPAYHFHTNGEEVSNFTNDEFLEVIENGKKHCYRGDVFQIVLSRKFSTPFKGDEFNVYRTLRSINPSPYLFYFDFGSFKIFGSSPEAQIVINKNKASIYPIAGTFRRTGNDKADEELAKKLYDDPKESSEHVMLVDLARNDLSRNGKEVKVETFKEIQFYSHVIHLVSKVTGTLSDDKTSIRMVADTFPAGTLSGAPKHMAMQLIDRYEKQRRGYYGGAIGFMGFNGDFNHAIMIRSFLSKNNTLYYQAGAGVVAKSDTRTELEEVNNKLAALRKAIKLAEEKFKKVADYNFAE